MSPTSCRRCSKWPAPAIEDVREANCRRSWASPGGRSDRTSRVAAHDEGPSGLGSLRQSCGTAGRLEAALAIQAIRQGRLGTVQPSDRPGRAYRPRRGATRQAEGNARPLERLRPGQQRDPAQPFHLRNPGRQAATARPGRSGLPATDLQAAVRAAQGHGGRSQTVSGCVTRNWARRTKFL